LLTALDWGQVNERIVRTLLVVVDHPSVNLALQLFEDAHQPQRDDRGVHLDVQRLAVEVINHLLLPAAPLRAA